jgi:molybdenum cofactor cytidylyltransferase
VSATDRLAVALLAAGCSRRFGASDKLGALLGGKPLLHWSAEAGRAINAAQHFLVTGAAPLQQDLPGDYRVIVNDSVDEGLSSSLRLAAQAAGDMGASALLILLGDMPMVTAGHLRALVAAADPARPVFSRTPGGAPQPPALFPVTQFAALQSMSGDSGARSLAKDALFVESGADLLIDVDTAEDLARCARLIAGR